MDKGFPLSKKEYLEAIDFIKMKHNGQYRRFTLAPYWIHPIQTAVLVMKHKKSHAIDELVIASLCHDLLEDTETESVEIYAKYGKVVMSLVDELTSNKTLCEEMGKTAYLQEKMKKMSSWGLVIKLCDRLSNVSDFLFTSDEFIKKYSLETKNILSYIKEERELTETHVRIIADIEKVLSIY